MRTRRRYLCESRRRAQSLSAAAAPRSYGMCQAEQQVRTDSIVLEICSTRVRSFPIRCSILCPHPDPAASCFRVSTFRHVSAPVFPAVRRFLKKKKKKRQVRRASWFMLWLFPYKERLSFPVVISGGQGPAAAVRHGDQTTRGNDWGSKVYCTAVCACVIRDWSRYIHGQAGLSAHGCGVVLQCIKLASPVQHKRAANTWLHVTD